MIVTARDLLTETVPRVPAEARPADYERELASGRMAAFAVYDGDTFLGLAPPAAVVTFPHRIFADLCATAAPPIAADTPLAEILREMDRRSTTVLAVADPDGRFLGVVSAGRITELLLWQAESRLQGLRQVLATTVDLGADRTLEDVLQRVVDLAAQLTGAREGVLELLDDDGRVAKRFGAAPAASAAGYRRLQGSALRAPEEGAPSTPAPGPAGGNAGTRPTLAAPLHLRGRTLGRLAVWGRGPAGRFTAEDQVLLAALADQAAIAVENARLFQATREQLDELRRTHARLLQAEKLSAMGQLLASVAHELNNPLAVVLGQSELLARLLADTPHARRLERITQAAQRCGRIVRNYLALARQRPPERKTVDLNLVVREALELLAYTLRVDDVEVTLDLAGDLPLLAADPHELHQVVLNLVTNAHHALRVVPPPRRLRLATRADDPAGRVCLEVADSGPGIPPEVKPRIFEPFFTTKPAGTGLGLSVCQSIVDAHQGTIEVESAPGRGATFRVLLPRGEPAPPVDERCLASPAAPGPRKTILVVDDEPAIREVLAEILAEEDHTLDTAADGAEALAKLERGAYDLVLLDLRMPGVDGLAFFQRATARNPHLGERFVFLTGDVLNPEVRAFLDRTPGPVLRKPFSVAELRAVVHRAVSGPPGPGGRAPE